MAIAKTASAPASFATTVRTHTSGGDGEVTHRGADCSVLVDVAALIIAMAIDPTAGAQPAIAPTPNTQAGSSPKIPPGPWVEVDDETPPGPNNRALKSAERARRNRLVRGAIPTPVIRARLVVGSDLGSLPDPQLGIGVAAHGQIGPYWADLGVWASGKSAAEVQTMPGAGADFRLLAAGGRICRESLQLLARWSPCVGIEIGQFFATSYGVDAPVSERRVWLSAIGSLSASWNVSKSISIRLDNQLGINARRERFRVLGDIIHQPKWLHWRALAGLERSFR